MPDWMERGPDNPETISYRDDFPAVRRRIVELVQAAIDSGGNFNLKYAKEAPGFYLYQQDGHSIVFIMGAPDATD